MSTTGETYHSIQVRLVSLVVDLDHRDQDAAVPACPGWRVRDVVGHLTGIAADMLDSRFPTGGFDVWTAEQVEARSSVPLAVVIEEWSVRTPSFVEAMEGPLAMGADNFVADIVSHELDIRNALHRRDGRDAPELVPAIETFVGLLGARVDDGGLPALRVRAGDQELIAGTARVGPAMAGPPFEVLRSLSSRRTSDEIRELEWEGDPTPYLALIGPYQSPERSLGERGGER